MKNIYEECPILENDRFLLRKIEGQMEHNTETIM